MDQTHQVSRLVWSSHANHFFPQTTRNQTLAKRNPRFEMFEHRILRVEQCPVFKSVGDFEYKLLAYSIRYQKVLVALARQLSRSTVNVKVFGYDRRSRFSVERR